VAQVAQVAQVAKVAEIQEGVARSSGALGELFAARVRCTRSTARPSAR
jgi:hypothetical protein